MKKKKTDSCLLCRYRLKNSEIKEDNLFWCAMNETAYLDDDKICKFYLKDYEKNND